MCVSFALRDAFLVHILRISRAAKGEGSQVSLKQ